MQIVRIAAIGVAIGAPSPIIRHRFGGNLRAARTGHGPRRRAPVQRQADPNVWDSRMTTRADARREPEMLPGWNGGRPTEWSSRKMPGDPIKEENA